MNKKINNFIRMFSRLKLSSFFRFYKLKYFTGENEKKYNFHLKNGLDITVNKKAGDLTTLFEIFVNEDYKYSNKSKKDLKILDIGANVGYFSLYMSRKFPDSQIFSFEPFPATYDRLKENLKLNNTGNVKVYQLAVSNFNGSADFYSIDWAGCNTLIKDKFDEGQYETTTVETIAFEEINKLTGIDEYDYAKIDCEGSEYSIFLKSPDTAIKAVKSFVIEVHSDPEYSGDDLIKRFNELGYKTNFQDNILTADSIN
jgi:FkbM family methyltransferase